MAQTDLALEALKLLKEWSTWIAAINTGAIVATASMFQNNPINGGFFLTTAVVCFGLSVVFAATLLGEIPSITQRLVPGSDKTIHSYKTQWGLPLAFFAAAEHMLFLLGLASFVGFLIQKII